MLANMLFCLNVVLPTFAVIFFGYLAVRFGIVDRPMMSRLSRVVFTWCLSCRIFLDISGGDARQMKDVSVTAYCFLATIITYIIIWFFSWKFLKRRESIGAFIQACYRSSFTVLGLAMVRNMAGEAGVARSALLLSMVAFVYNVLAVLCLSKGAKGELTEDHRNFRIVIINILKKLVKNPLIIAVLLGLPFSLFSIRLPFLLFKPVQYLGDIAVPMSLLCIGATLDTSKIKNCFSYAAGGAFIKTFALAIVVVPVAVLVGFRGLDLAIIAILFTAANPSACYVMAVSMNNDGDLAATGILFSTIMSVFSTTLALYFIKMFGFF